MVPALEDSLSTHVNREDTEGCRQMKEHEEIARQIKSSRWINLDL